MQVSMLQVLNDCVYSYSFCFLSSAYSQFGRKTIYLVGGAILFCISLASAILTQLQFKNESVIGYVLIVLLCLFVFGHSASWL
jgi:hypothetical protein